MDRAKGRWVRVAKGLAYGLLVLSTCAQAGSFASRVDAKALGTTESLQRYCAKVAPKAAAELGNKARRLEQGASSGDVSVARRSDAYRKAYEAVTDFVAKVDAHNAARPCSEALARGN